VSIYPSAEKVNKREGNSETR